MICANCGTENRPGRKFCAECASPLASICPSCGASNQPDEKFCGECATPLGATGAPAQPTSARPTPAAAVAAPVAQRRLVSILFADLVGFTTLAEGRDAEETRELLTRYFDLCRNVIERYGGTVEKFIGDAVMAVWGAPVAREDDAERAVRAALDLVDAVRSLGPGIEARAGVLTGEAAVTIGATNQGMVAGDLVNTASRLQSAAAPGSVLVGEATERAASVAIVFEPAGEQALKGKAFPVPAWRALRVVAERGGKGRSDTLEAPFVGREDELRMLKDLFHATSREQRARCMSVIGPAGIGKSRLAWEFTKYLDGLVEQVWWHDGRSPAYGEGISFWALGEMVRGRCGLLETDDPGITRTKVAATVSEHIPDESERRWIEPALLTLLGVGSGMGSEQLFGAWRTFFERLAATAPVVMVFEDHHYADTGLLDFVDHLLEWSRNVPIYVLTLARPELLERRPDWGAGKRNFNSLYLEPLSDGFMRALLAGLVPGLPEAAIRVIVERADGMPLYAVETVRMLLAQGRLAVQDGIYRPVGDLTTLAVPETLTALIASRLDGLAPDDRALVSGAAVLGQSFTLAALSAVSGTDPAILEPRLQQLVRRELLTLEADPRSPELGQYAFVQALIREVAYNTLARADRKVRHLAAARYFESLGSGELAGVLAGHYLAAQENSAEGPEADALAVQARIALSAAAERASALGSPEQAVVFLRQALTVTSDAAEEAELLERAGEAASAAAHHDEAEALLRQAVGLHRERGDRPAIARAVAALGHALLEAYRTAPGLAILEPAADELDDLGADPAYVAILGQLARGYMLQEQPERAVAVADRALAAAERADLVALVADTLVTKGTALANLGRNYEGIGVVEAGRRLAERHGLTLTALRARNNLVSFLVDVDPAAAMELGRAGFADARRLGLRASALVLLHNTAEGAFWLGGWDLSELEAALGEEPDPGARLAVLVQVIRVRAWRGEDVDPLVEDIQLLAAEIAEVDDPQTWSIAAVGLGHHRFALGHLVAAAAEYRRAAASLASAPSCHVMAARASLGSSDAQAAAADLESLVGTGVHGSLVEARRASIQAGLAALDGRPADALALYADALRIFRDLGVVVDEAFTAIEMATLLDPDLPEVRAAADTARAILARLGAQPFLERLDAAMHRGMMPGSQTSTADRQPSSTAVAASATPA